MVQVLAILIPRVITYRFRSSRTEVVRLFVAGAGNCAIQAAHSARAAISLVWAQSSQP